jgi:hypothetical protein
MKEVFDRVVSIGNDRFRPLVHKYRWEPYEYPLPGYEGSKEDLQKAEDILCSLALRNITQNQLLSSEMRDTCEKLFRLLAPTKLELRALHSYSKDDMEILAHIVSLTPSIKELQVGYYSLTEMKTRMISDVILSIPKLEEIKIHFFGFEKNFVFKILPDIKTLLRITGVGPLSKRDCEELCTVLPHCKGVQSISIEIIEGQEEIDMVTRAISEMKSLHRYDVKWSPTNRTPTSQTYDICKNVPLLLSSIRVEFGPFLCIMRYLNRACIKELCIYGPVDSTEKIDDAYNETISSMQGLECFRLCVDTGKPQRSRIFIDGLAKLKSIKKLIINIEVDSEAADVVGDILKTVPLNICRVVFLRTHQKTCINLKTAWRTLSD